MSLKSFADLIKLGIVIFVVISGLAGYALSFSIETPFNVQHFLAFVAGLAFISAGSLALNQVQEYKTDKKMARTAKRPVAAGKIKPTAAGILAVAFIVAGSELLLKSSAMSCLLGWITVLLYNGFYTYWWKPKWVYAAIPGAVPGALPVTIGFAANSPDIFRNDSVYLFLVMFLWQMPHFWALAIKYKDDYASGNVPTLPVALGIDRTLYQMGVYTFLYVFVAMASPWFVHASWAYLAAVVPVSAKLLWEFRRFFLAKGEQGWLKFFLWINLSLLVYLIVPVIDKWNFLFIKSN